MSSFGGAGGPIEVAFVQIEGNTQQLEAAIQEVRLELLRLNRSTANTSAQLRREFGSAGTQVIKTFKEVERSVTQDLLSISTTMATSFEAGQRQASAILARVGGDFEQLDQKAKNELIEINRAMATAFRSGTAEANSTIERLQRGFVELNAVAGTNLELINRKLARDVQGGVVIAEQAVSRLSREFVQFGFVADTTIRSINTNLRTGFISGATTASGAVDRVGDQFQVLALQALSVTELIKELFRSASNSADRSLRSIGGPDAFAESVLSAELAARRIQNAFSGLRIRVPIGGLSIGITSLASALGVAATAAVAFGTIATAQLERIETGFTGLLGSELRAEKQLDSLVQLAATTPFEVAGLAESEQKLLASADAMGIAKSEIEDTLVVIGDLATSLGQPIDAVDSVTRALGQMASRGQVMTEELIQLSEALPGFPVFDELARGLGVTTEALDEMLREGTVPAQESIRILINAMQQFPGAAGAMAAQSQTLIGLLSTLRDVINLQLIDAFRPFTDSLRVVMKDAAGILEDFFGDVAGPINDIAVKALRTVVSAIEALGPPLGQFFADLNDFFEIIGPSAGRFGTALAGLFGRLGPLLTAVATASVPLIDAFTDIASDTLPRVIDVVAEVVVAIGPMISIIGQLNSFVLPVLVTLLEAIPTPILAGIVVLREFTKISAAFSLSLDKAKLATQGFLASISPVGIAIAAVTAGLSLWATANAEAEAREREHEQRVASLASTFRDASSATVVLREDIERLIDSGEDLSDGIGFIDDADAQSVFDEMGLSAQRAASLVLEGTDAVERFAQAQHDGSEESGVAALALIEYSATAQEAAERALEGAVILGDFTQAQVDAAIASTDAADGTNNYVAAINLLLAAQTREEQAEANLAEERERARSALASLNQEHTALMHLITPLQTGQVDLAQGFATVALAANAAELSDEQLAAVQNELGVSSTQLAGAMVIAEDAMKAFEEGVKGSIPTIVGQINELDEITFDGLLQAFRDAFEAAVNFEANLAVLAAFPNVQLAAAQAGPEVAAVLAQGFRDGNIAALEEMENLAAGTAQAGRDTVNATTEWATNLTAETIRAGTDATAGYDQALGIAAATQQETIDARIALQNQKDGITTAATEDATSATTAYSNSLGISEETLGDVQRAQIAIQNQKEGITAAANDTALGATDGWAQQINNVAPISFAAFNDARVQIAAAKDPAFIEAAAVGSSASTGYQGGLAAIPGASADAVSASIANMQAQDTYTGPFGVGVNVGSGFLAGLNSTSARIAAAANAIARSASDALASAAQVESPSKVTMKIGEEFGEGFIVGMDAKTQQAMLAAQSLSNAAVSGIGDPTAPLVTGAGGDTININIQVTAAPGATEQDGRRLAAGISSAVSDTLARRRIRAEARIAS